MLFCLPQSSPKFFRFGSVCNYRFYKRVWMHIEDSPPYSCNSQSSSLGYEFLDSWWMEKAFKRETRVSKAKVQEQIIMCWETLENNKFNATCELAWRWSQLPTPFGFVTRIITRKTWKLIEHFFDLCYIKADQIYHCATLAGRYPVAIHYTPLYLTQPSPKQPY